MLSKQKVYLSWFSQVRISKETATAILMSRNAGEGLVGEGCAGKADISAGCFKRGDHFSEVNVAELPLGFMMAVRIDSGIIGKRIVP